MSYVLRGMGRFVTNVPRFIRVEGDRVSSTVRESDALRFERHCDAVDALPLFRRLVLEQCGSADICLLHVAEVGGDG